MHEHINIDVLTNWVSMLRADVDGAICLSDDHQEARFYEKITHERARVVPAERMALTLLDSVQQRGVEGVVAVVKGRGAPEDAHNIFRPAKGDVLAVLLFSQSSKAVITEICGNPWLAACEKENGPVLDRVASLARCIRLVREACNGEGGAACTDSTLSVIDWTSLKISWEIVDGLVGQNASKQIKDDCGATLTGDASNSLVGCDGCDAIHIFAGAAQFYKPRGLADSAGRHSKPHRYAARWLRSR